ncbi:MAG: DNA polymerase III subunit gamma/tau [Oscillospiraceae bacterium]|nr:DNA polymerase III subunit gamma/tau [Oscillospiraceae bacterium]
MYQALYRKWRPRTFDEVVGQEHITSILKSQVDRGRLSHAYLFTGTRGTGKTTCAKILSRAANCENPVNGSPCNKCPACVGIENGSILDVLEFDAASNSKVDDIRAVLEETVYTPAYAKKRVYIIDEVHMLSNSAFNALLKTLEEPPEHLMFILATTEQHKVPATILSRCQKFAFRRIGAETLKGRLNQIASAEGIPLTDDGAALVARMADGSLRDALSLLDQCSGAEGELNEDTVAEFAGIPAQSESARLLYAVAEKDGAAVLDSFNSLYMSGKEAVTIFDELLVLCRDLLIMKKAPKNSGAISSPTVRKTISEIARSISDARAEKIVLTLQAARRALQQSANRRVDGELYLAMLCREEEEATPAPRREERPAGKASTAASAAPWDEPPAIKKTVGAPDIAAKPVEKPASVTKEKAPWDQPPSIKTPAEPDLAARPAPPPAEPDIPSADWDAILEKVESRLGIAEYFTLSNPALAKPRFVSGKLVIEVDSEFNLTTLNDPRIVETLKQAAGMPVEINLPGASKGTDGLEELMRFGRENPNKVKIF